MADNPTPPDEERVGNEEGRPQGTVVPPNQCGKRVTFKINDSHTSVATPDPVIGPGHSIIESTHGEK